MLQKRQIGVEGGGVGDGLEGHVMRTIFILEAAFEPYDCANLNLTVIPSQTVHRPLSNRVMVRNCGCAVSVRCKCYS